MQTDLVPIRDGNRCSYRRHYGLFIVQAALTEWFSQSKRDTFRFFESPLRFPKYPRQPDLYMAQL
jgi:hypothetical protein